MQAFVLRKVQAVNADVAKLDAVTDLLLHIQLLDFCKNTHVAFLGRHTPTPHISEIFAQVDNTILEAVCRNGTGGGHTN